MGQQTPTLYYDPISQPCKAIYWWSKVAKVKLNVKLTWLGRDEHMAPSFLKINPRHQIPVLTTEHFNLSESQAILQYLAESNNIKNKWFGSNIRERAQVSQYLSWYHTNLRYKLIYQFLFQLVILPILVQSPKTEDSKLQNFIETNAEVFKQMDEFLQNKTYFLGDKLSIVDFVFAGEVISLLSLDLTINFFKKYEYLQKWINTIKKLPFFEEVHQTEVNYWYKILQDFQQTGNAEQAMIKYQEMMDIEEKRLKQLPDFI